MVPQTTPERTETLSAATRLDYLDGVRAAAALFVVLHHTWLFSTVRYPIRANDGILGLATNWLLYGHLSVDVFIVLSGFCLILPVAWSVKSQKSGKSEQLEIPGGVLRFYQRRARRILPPYLAALLISVGLRFAHDTVTHAPGFPATGFPATDLLINLLLLQDVIPSAAASFNAPLWSVAVEAKIYLFFPLLVLLLRIKKYGNIAVLLLTAAVGYGSVDVVLLLAPKLPLSELAHSCPWYLFLFGMGVVSGAAFRKGIEKRQIRLWQIGAAASLFLLAALLTLFPWRGSEAELSRQFPLIDAVAGILTAACLVLLGSTKSVAARLFAAPPLVRIGTFAYSIYLIHYPILQLLEGAVVKPLVGNTDKLLRFAVLLIIGLPLVLACAYGFFLIAERPFMSRRRIETEAVLSPAP